MKNRMRIYAALTMVIAMMTSFLAACGSNNAPANTVIDTPTSTPESTSEPTMEPEDGIVDSETLEDIPTSDPRGGGNVSIGNLSSEGKHYNYTEQLPNGVVAWSDVYPFVDNIDMARHYTYFKNVNGDAMTFVWDAPTTIGVNFGLSDDGKTLNMGDSETPTYRFYALSGKLSNESDKLKNYESNIIMRAGVGEADENSFQILEDNDEFYRVVFRETMYAFGKSYIGFACFFDDYNVSMCLQFEFFCEESVFDEDEALAVINSITRIDLEEYESTHTTNE